MGGSAQCAVVIHVYVHVGIHMYRHCLLFEELDLSNKLMITSRNERLASHSISLVTITSSFTQILCLLCIWF